MYDTCHYYLHFIMHVRVHIIIQRGNVYQLRSAVAITAKNVMYATCQERQKMGHKNVWQGFTAFLCMHVNHMGRPVELLPATANGIYERVSRFV